MKTLFFMLSLFISSIAWAKKNIVIVVNEQNPLVSLTTHQISEMYLKKNRIWPDGTPVRFFDRHDEAQERKTFLEHFLHRSSREIDQYWIGQKLYTGNSAPSQLTSDSMVRALVARFPGAISYMATENFRATKGIRKIEISGTP